MCWIIPPSLSFYIIAKMPVRCNGRRENHTPLALFQHGVPPLSLPILLTLALLTLLAYNNNNYCIFYLILCFFYFIYLMLCTYTDICTDKVKMDTPLVIEIYMHPEYSSHNISLQVLDAQERIQSSMILYDSRVLLLFS